MLNAFSRHKYVLSLFCVLFSSILAFGQSDNLQSDLNNSFKKFNLIRLNNQIAQQKAISGNSLRISTADKSFELNLIPNDLRSPDFRAEDTNADGVHTLEKGAVTTFKGNVAGVADSKVRITLDGAKIEGYFEANGEKFFIEPARNYSNAANAEDSIVYREKDLLKTSGITCESELTQKIENGKNFVSTQTVESVRSMNVIQIATEADSQFVTRFGSAAQANNEILSILNMVEGVYENDLSLTIKVNFQHTWSIADPFNSTSTNTLLVSFQNYWNLNFPATQYPRNEAHLFSGRSNVSGLGLSYIGAVCLRPDSSYGLNGWIDSAPANGLLTAHEIGHTIGANHVDATQNCDRTIMNALLSDTTPMTFCTSSRSEVGNYISSNARCLVQKTISKSTSFDFDGDGKSDVAIFRPVNGLWCIANSGNNSFSFVQFGQLGDKPVPADYDGDGKTDIAVYRGGTWFWLKSSSNTLDVAYFGAATDVPAPADFDGDGKADVAVFRPSEGVWHRLLSGSGNAYSAIQFGAAGDIPVPADYDGDGKADINVFRPSNGAWYRLNSSNKAFFGVQFGQLGDKPLMGDFDGDGKADVTVFRPLTGSWYSLNSSNGAFSTANFGAATDIPTAADFDGDGKTDISVFRPLSGNWYRFNSSDNSFAAAQFGDVRDVPVPSFYFQ